MKIFLALTLIALSSNAFASYDIQCMAQGTRGFPILQTRNISVDSQCAMLGSYTSTFAIYINSEKWTDYRYGGTRDLSASYVCEVARRSLDGILRSYLHVEFNATAAQGRHFTAITVPQTEQNVRVLAGLIRQDEHLENRVAELETQKQALFAELCERVGRGRRRELGCR